MRKLILATFLLSSGYVFGAELAVNEYEAIHCKSETREVLMIKDNTTKKSTHMVYDRKGDLVSSKSAIKETNYANGAKTYEMSFWLEDESTGVFHERVRTLVVYPGSQPAADSTQKVVEGLFIEGLWWGWSNHQVQCVVKE